MDLRVSDITNKNLEACKYLGKFHGYIHFFFDVEEDLADSRLSGLAQLLPVLIRIPVWIPNWRMKECKYAKSEFKALESRSSS